MSTNGSPLDRAALTVLEIADDPDAWTAAGFTVSDSAMILDGVEFRFVGSGPSEQSAQSVKRGIRCWSLDGVSVAGERIDGLAHCGGPSRPILIDPAHPNHIDRIDHLVVTSPNIDRTVDAFAAVGIESRRTRTFTVGNSERQQVFFWLGSTILELVGVVGEQGDGPATFWGLACVSNDLDATVAALGELMTEPKTAIQPGRRISTLQTEALDISVPLAVMTPHSPT